MPAMPTISPPRTLRLMSWKAPPDKCLTASAPADCIGPAPFAGNTLVTVRPTISRSISSSDISAIGAEPLTSPSRITVTRSAICRTSCNRCEI